MKEWKENSNSLRAAISVKSPNSTNERAQDDFYATDPRALDLLINSSPGPRLGIWLQCEFISLCENKDVIWECACGNGNYSKGSLREVYIFSKRIECWKNGEQPKDKCGSIANYAWYVFQKGYKGKPTLYWL